MQKDLESFYSTVLVFGLVSAVLYLFLLRPLFGQATAAARPANAAASDPRVRNDRGGTRRHVGAAAAGGGGDHHYGVANNNNNGNGGGDGRTKDAGCTRFPPHVAPNSAKMARSGGSNLLVDGMLAFRHSKAAAQETALEAAVLSANRKDRARILSRLLEDGSSVLSITPPMKGSSIVVSVPVQDVACPKLRRVLFLLATYYNLMVIVVVESAVEPKDRATILQQLRGGEKPKDEKPPAEEEKKNTCRFLSADVLPDHRIVFSSTVSGRVAFARQLQRIELVLDFEEEVKDNLSRFGHCVVLYGKKPMDDKAEKGLSRLGNELFSSSS